MKLNILKTEKSTGDSISIYFERTLNLQQFKAGQYGLFTFEIDGIVYKRTYSFHTSPNENEMGITVRAIKYGVVSNYLQSQDPVSISLEGIDGDFVFEPSKEIKRHLIMFAGGSGITPIYSMIKTLMLEEPRSTVSLIYTNKSYSRIIFRNELHKLELKFSGRLKVHQVLSQHEEIPADFPVFYKGRLTPLIIKKIIKAIHAEFDYNLEYYLCGPTGLMDSIASTILSIGPGHPRIKREIFYIPTKSNEFDFSSLEDREIILQTQDMENLVIVKSGQSILKASLEHGVKLRYSCTEGQCGTCRAKLISGEVKLRKNYVLTEDELKDGQILLCQAFPVSEGITIRTTL